jgi:hypothetical protein
MTKADKKFQSLLAEVIKGFNRRLGKEMCEELHANCFDCKTRIAIAVLNEWIDVLGIDVKKKREINSLLTK